MAINKIGFDYDVTGKTNVVINASGGYIPPLSDEEIAYRKTKRYKVKTWFKYCWIARRYNSLAFRLKMIWKAITDIGYFDNY